MIIKATARTSCLFRSLHAQYLSRQPSARTYSLQHSRRLEFGSSSPTMPAWPYSDVFPPSGRALPRDSLRARVMWELYVDRVNLDVGYDGSLALRFVCTSSTQIDNESFNGFRTFLGSTSRYSRDPRIWNEPPHTQFRLENLSNAGTCPETTQFWIEFHPPGRTARFRVRHFMDCLRGRSIISVSTDALPPRGDLLGFVLSAQGRGSRDWM